jgi:hypothetical protein
MFEVGGGHVCTTIANIENDRDYRQSPPGKSGSNLKKTSATIKPISNSTVSDCTIVIVESTKVLNK